MRMYCIVAMLADDFQVQPASDATPMPKTQHPWLLVT